MDSAQAHSPLPWGASPVERAEGGLRTLGCFKNHCADRPLVTVITVVFNAAQQIEATLQSVLAQTYDNIEYLVIDGGSDDGTLDILRKYEDRIDYWVSEPDAGIYDAMNKGVDLASGAWINFMNAGDSLFDAHTINALFSDPEKTRGVDVIFGDVVMIYPQYGGMSKVKKAGQLRDLWKGMQFSHQSVLIATAYQKRNKFNPAYRLAADFGVLYSAYRQNRSFCYAGQVLASTRADGLSDVQRVRVYRERLRIVARLGDEKPALLYYSIRMVDAWARWALKKILPVWIIKKMILRK
jgi:glycosyltransferase involved in cell wall biosynthesis